MLYVQFELVFVLFLPLLHNEKVSANIVDDWIIWIIPYHRYIYDYVTNSLLLDKYVVNFLPNTIKAVTYMFCIIFSVCHIICLE